MAWLPLQHDVLHHPVPVPVPPRRVGGPGVQDQLPLQGSALLGAGPHVVGVLPALDVLIHRLAVEEDQGDPLRLRLVHNHRRPRPVHHVDAQDVAPPGQKAVHVVHLGGLVVPAVRDEQDDFLSDAALLLLGQLLQALGHGGDEGVVLAVQGHANA